MLYLTLLKRFEWGFLIIFDTTKLVPPIAILDKATLTMMLDSLPDTPEYHALLYVLKKLG